MAEAFYVVMDEALPNTVKVRFRAEGVANDAARKAALAEPGRKFYVLRAIAAVQTKPLEVRWETTYDLPVATERAE